MSFKRVMVFILGVIFFIGLVGCDEKIDEIDLSTIEEIKLHFVTNSEDEIKTVVINQELLSTIDVDVLKEVKLEDLEYLEPKKEGYQLIGWYFDENFENELTEDSPILKSYVDMLDNDSIKVEITIYAKWIKVENESFTITYHLNGGVNDSSNIKVFDNTMDDFTLLEPTREGYEFKGWFKEEEYINEISLITSVDDNLDLYAKWDEIVSNEYYITYYLDGGVNSDENISVFYVGDKDFVLVDPIKEGYDFLGWYSDKAFENRVTVLSNLEHSLNLYARWEERNSSSEFLYFYLDGDEYTVTGVDYTFEGVLIIPSTYHGYPVTKIGDGALSSNDQITEVVLPDSITDIGGSAFESSHNITHVNIPDSVTHIGSSAFSHMDSLVSVVIGNGVTELEMFTFNSCENLESVIFGENIITVGKQAVSFNPKMTELVLNDKLESIGESAFYGATSLTSIIIPNSVTEIGPFAFFNCPNLTINMVLEEEGDDWDYRWNNSGCPVVWGYDPNQPVYTIDYHLDGGTNHILNPVTITKEIYLNEPTKEGYLFLGWYTEIEYINEIDCLIPLDDLTISVYAKWLKNDAPDYLTYVVYEDHVVVTGMTGDETNIEIPATYMGLPVTEIADQAFYVNRYLESVVFNENLIRVGNLAFGGDYNITELVFPSTLRVIGDGAFNGLGIEHLNIPSTVTSYGEDVFGNNRSLVSVTFPDNMEKVPYGFLIECSMIEEIVLPSSVKEIGEQAFAGLSSLSSINLENVEVIGKNSFSNCSSLVEIELSNQLMIISDYAFAYNSSLESIKLPSHLVYIGKAAFSGCYELTTIDLPDSLIEIEEDAFWGCNLTSIHFPSSLEMIGSQAFRYNDFTELYLPSSIKSIGDLAFRDCKELNSIYLSNQIDYLGERVFRDTGYQVKMYLDGSEGSSLWATTWKDYFRGQVYYESAFPQISITYHLDGSKNNEGNLNYVSGTNAFLLYAPEKSGYYFEGWYSDMEYTNKVVGIPSGITEDIVLYAKFIEINDDMSKITYQLNGGVLVNESMNYYTNGIDFDLPLAVKAGYVFEGWYLDEEFTNPISTIPSSSVGEVEVYAKFSCDYLLYEEYDDYVVITGLKQQVLSVEIPSTINGKDVTIIKENAFAYEKSINEITLPSTIKEIQEGAFMTIEIQSIILPEGLEKIGNYVFSTCLKLEEIVIPSTVVYLGEGIFSHCKKLVSVVFENDLTSIPVDTFRGCESFTTFTVPEGVTVIGESAFRDCNYLESIILPSTLKEIGYSAFKNDHLTEVDLPEGLITIGEYAFNENFLEVLFIPDSVTDMGNNVFSSNQQLKSITIGANVTTDFSQNDFYRLDSIEEFNVSENNPKYTSIDGVLYENLTTLKLLKYPIKKEGSSFDIPDGVKVVMAYSFEDTNLYSINIPNTVVEIGRYALLGSNNIQSVYIPSSVTTIGSGAFGIHDILIYTGHDTLPIGWDPYFTEGKIYYSIIEGSVSRYLNCFEYFVNSDHIEISKFLNTSYLSIDIPYEIEGVPVTTILSDALYNINGRIIIPSSVTNIEENGINSSNMTIYIEEASRPNTWDENWNSGKGVIVWDVFWFKMDLQGGESYQFPFVGTIEQPQSIGYGYVPHRDGYTFGGWYTNEDCTDGYEFYFNEYPEEPEEQPHEITIIYAKWVPIED